MLRCYKCGHAYVQPNAPGFQDVCDGCGSYLHCCFNCRFHDEYAHNHCGEPQAEYVSDPNGLNRCEYFVFKAGPGERPVSSDADDTKPARRRSPDWRNVRGDEPRPGGRDQAANAEKAQQARQKLEELFRKGE
jgi:hypothetical protein